MLRASSLGLTFPQCTTVHSRRKACVLRRWFLLPPSSRDLLSAASPRTNARETSSGSVHLPRTDEGAAKVVIDGSERGLAGQKQKRRRRPPVQPLYSTAHRIEIDASTVRTQGGTGIADAGQHLRGDDHAIPFSHIVGSHDPIAMWNASPVVVPTGADDSSAVSPRRAPDGSRLIADPSQPANGSWNGSSSGTRAQQIHIMANSPSAYAAWGAYRALVSSSKAGTYPFIAFSHLHRLARLLSTQRPRSRELFLRLLSVLTHIWISGGRVHLWEWNALMDFAGKTHRKTRPSDYKASLDIYNDMISGNAPGTTFPGRPCRPSQVLPSSRWDSPSPDIYTYTTLLSIATHTLHPPSIHHATALLATSGLPPTRITYLTLLRYLTQIGDLAGVRSTLAKMKEQDLSLGVDGVNAVLWAFARNKSMSIASTIYRVLRHNVSPERDIGEHNVHVARQFLDTSENLVIVDGLVPNCITYTILIQTFAYHGDLARSLQVFIDMLSTPNVENARESWLLPDAHGADPDGHTESTNYPPTLAAFRALFLGFARHASSARSPPSSSPLYLQVGGAAPRVRWNLASLVEVFDSFMNLPDIDIPSERTIYWVMVAFAKASNNDRRILTDVWLQLTEKFDVRRGGRLGRIGRDLEN
ncbi:hypothetical protein PLICRDRAFT_150935 [Plicaturopsis crispa FD-325 SS-3]|nr:hypothetical protein PLICRDRAFT_150935 [Plicaturopsis crispa FD-325 SS-3]